MKRRTFLRSSGIAFGASLLPAHQWLARLFSQDTANMTLLRNNVGVFTERGGTIGWMIEDGGIVVVDSQFPEQAGHLIDRIREKSSRRIDLLINTHHHGDHTGGNIAFKEIVDHVVAHTNSKSNQQRVAKARNAEDTQLYPDTTFDLSWSQKVGKETITANYFGPAHTDGDAVIHFQNANIAHVGDLMFNRRYPFIDRSAGASIQNWIEVLQNIRKTYDNDTRFIFGHAFDPQKITGTKDDLKAFEKYLSSLLKFVRKEIKAGKSKEDILKAIAIPGGEQWQGDGIQRSLTSAYEELTEGK